MKIKLFDAEYEVRELGAPAKIKLTRKILPVIKEFYKNYSEGGEIKVTDLLDVAAQAFEWAEDAIPELMRQSVPDYVGQWDIVPESMLREPLRAVLEVNDFGGFFGYILTRIREIKDSTNS